MSSSAKIDLGLTGYDELFMDDKGREESRLPKLREVPISDIDDLPDHPFKVKMDEAMEQLIRSVKAHGVITPALIRPKEDGRYEMVSGHRRKFACKLAGLETVKTEIRELTRDEAIIIMVESNLQRPNILPSEKAFSYKMHLEATKRQGERTDLTSRPLVGKLDSAEALGEQQGDSGRQVQRYIRLTELITPLLDMVDEGRIAFRPAVELSYLTKPEQQALLEIIELEEATPSVAQAMKMKEFSKSGRLNEDVILSIMKEQKPNQKEKISFRMDKLRQYIPSSVSKDKTEDYVLSALKYYQRYQERQRARGQER